MSRLRSSMILLGICVAALLVGALRLLTERTVLPAGSSYSAQPDGALGLYGWSAALGGAPVRVTEGVLGQDSAQESTTLLVLQPESPIAGTLGASFDGVPDKGGTLLVAGDSFAWLLYARS